MVLDSLSEDRQTSKAVAMRHNLTTLVQSKGLELCADDDSRNLACSVVWHL